MLLPVISRTGSRTEDGFRRPSQSERARSGSSTFLNVAVWESVGAFRGAFGDRTFQEGFARYPDSNVASPHLFQKGPCPASAWTGERWRSGHQS